MKAPSDDPARWCAGSSLLVDESQVTRMPTRYATAICPACGRAVRVTNGKSRIRKRTGGLPLHFIRHSAKVTNPRPVRMTVTAMKDTARDLTLRDWVSEEAGQRQWRKFYELALAGLPPSVWGSGSHAFSLFVSLFTDDRLASVAYAGIGKLIIVTAAGQTAIGSDRRDVWDRLVANLFEERTRILQSTAMTHAEGVRLGVLARIPCLPALNGVDR